MNRKDEHKLEAAWRRIDERHAMLVERHRVKGDIPLYESGIKSPVSQVDLNELTRALGMALPFELVYSFRRWDGRWIAHDHVIDFGSANDGMLAATAIAWTEEQADWTFEEVIGPVNPLMHSPRRIYFGGHEYSGSSLFLDYEDPPEGGRLGQVIRIGEEPIAQWVAGSFAEFLDLVADAPVHDDDPDFDPLAWRG